MVFLKKLDKVKKASGQILAYHEIFEKSPSKVKTFGIVCTYKSKFGYHNMYKEVINTSLNGAVAKLTSEMVGRHRAQRESLVIVRTTELKGDLEHEAKRRQIRQVVKHYIKFPLLLKRIRPKPAFRKVFRPSRLFFLLKKLIIVFIYQNKNYKIKLLLFFFNSFLLIY